MSIINGRDHQYGFGGKEEQNELGLGWIDITARNYDPALGRWMNIDPLAETSRRWSPYQYAYNNPMFFVDPDGMKANDWRDNGDGTWTAQAGDSAWTLARDAGISPEQANSIVESQLKPNYERESDGMVMSNVEVNDVVAIPEQVEAFEENEQAVSDLQMEMFANNLSQVNLLARNKSIVEDYEQDEKELSLQIEAGVFKPEGNDPGNGLRIAQSIKVAALVVKSIQVQKEVKKNNITIDSLENANAIKEEQIRDRGYIPKLEPVGID